MRSGKLVFSSIRTMSRRQLSFSLPTPRTLSQIADVEKLLQVFSLLECGVATMIIFIIRRSQKPSKIYGKPIMPTKLVAWHAQLMHPPTID